MSKEPEVPSPDAGAPAAAPTVDRGTYEIIRDRLVAHGRELASRAEALNAKRVALFGSTELALAGSERIRTENNCVPRDIAEVGGRLLFGYNVFIGLKSETSVSDVFSLHAVTKTDAGIGFQPIAPDAGDAFLADPQFVKEFSELYQYYKGTRLIQLRRVEGKLLAIFQIGAAITDAKVFRWSVDTEGRATYLDNRGERDDVRPASHDFEWTKTTRENFRLGREPHVSVLDEVFVDTVKGDLTIKVENNTEDGLGIYREPVDEKDQSLDDAEIQYAKLGGLILLKVLPYRETGWRHFVYNTRTRRVARIDAIGQSCVQLPEDHGLIFPGGYYLTNGETKSFETDVTGMEFERLVRAPNGEDVLYVFVKRDEGRYVLLPYNMIRKQVQQPIVCHGHSLFDDGMMVVFREASGEPTRVHTMQVWQTPFTSDVFAAKAPQTGSYLEKIGNADLVRGISDCLSLRREIEEQEPSVRVYEDLIRGASHVADAFYWLGSAEAGDLLAPINDVKATAELIVSEFEKTEALRKQARDAIEQASLELERIVRDTEAEEWTTLDAYVGAMARLRTERGKIITLREVRYVDRQRLDALEKTAVERYDALGERTVQFLLGDDALEPYAARVEALAASAEAVERVTETAPIAEQLDAVNTELDLLTDVVGNLKIDDATVRTRVLEGISEVLGSVNRARAILQNRRKALLSSEGVAEFGARFKLFGQNVASALALADSPEKCEEQLSKMMLQLEELESRFSEFDEFLGQLAAKREEVVDAFGAKRQSLVDERQRRADNTMQAAERILQGVVRRAQTFGDDAELNAFFASDAMVSKARELADRLRELGDSVRADEVEGRIKAARSDAARALRDRRDIYEDGTNVIRLGRHRFSVNAQPLDLTLIPREGAMYVHLAGTDFFQELVDPEFAATRDFWDQRIVSETPDVYRGEYLAASILADAEGQKDGLSLDALKRAAVDRNHLLDLVRAYVQPRYDEGYERGIHDADAAAILERLVALHTGAGLLRFSPPARAAACYFWALYDDRERRAIWERRAKSLGRMRASFAHAPAIAAFSEELASAIAAYFDAAKLVLRPDDARAAGPYLFEELAESPQRFVVSAEATTLKDGFLAYLDAAGSLRDFNDDLRELEGDPTSRFGLVAAWLDGFVSRAAEPKLAELRPALAEAAVLLLTDRKLDREVSSALGSANVEGLLGQHPRVVNGSLAVRLDEFLTRLGAFRHTRVPAFRAYQTTRHAVVERERKRLRLGEYTPKVMSSFVRNRLINEVYLPVIGDNLAKQIGALGDAKRTDLMGMLLLISPPGYGKTTLMEYVANRLGLIFMKVNGPSLGHAVVSLDPNEAPNATARQEVQKINLGLEMGNNVLLYLDDIQHTNPELLQKFISLCDAQRKIEGVWEGETKTYNLRGKRFAVCMAGNPYTESGEKFKIPDMLANRADTYNLGDILDGKEDLFALSYLENALTSNAVLSPLASRSPEDVPLLVRMAKGDEVQLDQLAYEYSSVELGEIRAVLTRLLRVQKTLLDVNKLYILSASQADAFRTEPPFKLQGSYRNMNKLAEKVVPVMNDVELEALVDDHYTGEAQTLTTGAEQNLLKLAELRGRMSPVQLARWDEIKRTFARVQMAGGADDDPVTRISGSLSALTQRVEGVSATIEKAFADAAQAAPAAAEAPSAADELAPVIERLGQTIAAMGASSHNDGEAEHRAVALLAQQFGMVARRIEGLGEVITKLGGEPSSHAPTSPANGGGTDLAPYLGRLDATLAALAAAPRGSEIVQSLPSGVSELIERMVYSIEEALMPAVRALEHEVRASEPATDPKMSHLLEKTLKNLDLLRDLLVALRKIDTTGLAAAVAPATKKGTRAKS